MANLYRTRRKSIEDYYGTLLEVEVVGHSAGFMVDLDRDTSQGASEKNGEQPSTFDSLTPDKARDLAKRLTDAADEIGGRS